jgi:hypothetical protein
LYLVKKCGCNGRVVSLTNKGCRLGLGSILEYRTELLFKSIAFIPLLMNWW